MRIIIFITSLIILAACGRSTEEIQADWTESLSAATSCMEDSECVLITPGCPFGCAAVVNQSKKEELEAKAKELREEYTGETGMSCNYSCVLPTVFTCNNGTCLGE